MTEEKFETTIEGMDFAFLSNAAVQLAIRDVPSLSHMVNPDREFIGLIEKSRKYLDIMFDQAISQYDEKKKEKTNENK